MVRNSLIKKKNPLQEANMISQQPVNVQIMHIFDSKWHTVLIFSFKMEKMFCHQTNLRFNCLATVKMASVIHESFLMWSLIVTT